MAMQNWISSTSANSATVKGLKLVTMGNQSRVISPTTKGLTMNEMRLVIYQVIMLVDVDHRIVILIITSYAPFQVDYNNFFSFLIELDLYYVLRSA